MATSVAARRPGVAGWMSHIPEGPPLRYPQADVIVTPAWADATALQKLNLRQYDARTVTGPNAAPIPQPTGRR